MKVENVNIEKNNWSVDIDGNTINVENKLNTLKLIVNDKLQDIQLGNITFDNIRLYGKLPNGKKIKVVVGGIGFKILCYIFVDNELVLEDYKEKEKVDDKNV